MAWKSIRMRGLPCQNCRRKFANCARQLCHTCYYTPEIRAKYPSTSKHAPGKGDRNCRSIPPAHPTTALPGSDEKMTVLEERVQQGVSLWHPDDARGDSESEGYHSRGRLLDQALRFVGG